MAEIIEPGIIIPTFEQQPGRITLSAADANRYIVQLGNMALDWQQETGRKIDTVAGSPRGSLEVVSGISQMLGLPGECVQSMTLNTRDPLSGKAQTGKVVQGQMPESTKIYDRVVLWGDDVRDSGLTEDTASVLLADMGAELVLRADIAYKPEMDEAEPKRPPDFYCFETNEWIEFPWERYKEYVEARNEMILAGADETQLETMLHNYQKALGYAV